MKYKTEKYNIKKTAAFIFLLFFSQVFCMEFEPHKCPALQAAIYPGNNGFSVMHVTANGYADSFYGFSYAGLSTSGKPSKERWTTRLLLKMAPGKSSQLNFLMTFPASASKQSNRFLIQADDPWGQPQKLYPLPVKYADSGILVFRSFAERHKILNTLTIDMKDNTATLSSCGAKKLKVLWHQDGIVLEGLPKGNDTLKFIMPFKVGFRGAENGITAIRRKTGRLFRWQLFPAEEIFYLSPVR